MKTSTAQQNNGRCPNCDDELTEDIAGRGFVRHKTDSDCQHGNGEKDAPIAATRTTAADAANDDN